MVLTPTDIANRALQRVGAGRIAAGALSTEDSKVASEVRACYDILRRAELRRNVWRFATRRAALRPLDSDSRRVQFPTWSSIETYAVNAVVIYNGTVYFSLVDSNLNNAPDSGFTFWSRYFGSTVASLFVTTTTYLPGEIVYDSGNAVYLSLISANSDVPPSANWRTLTGAALSSISFIYPISAGSSATGAAKNVYVRPVGFLRDAPEDPKAGSSSQLGAPSGLHYGDWILEGDFIVTRDAGVLVIRFVADIEDPSQFDALFVEGLASRIAFEICEPLTQSTSKLTAIASEYQKFMADARIVNGIETGPTEPPEDDYITCRW